MYNYVTPEIWLWMVTVTVLVSKCDTLLYECESQLAVSNAHGPNLLPQAFLYTPSQMAPYILFFKFLISYYRLQAVVKAGSYFAYFMS